MSLSMDESDLDLKTTIPLKTKNKAPKSPTQGILRDDDPKKISTKMMVRQALTDLKTKSRKGVSLQAIKKYIHENFKVDVERNNYLIKKSIKSAVENGSIIQTKGVGASGSFKIASLKEKVEKKKKKVEKPSKKEDKSEDKKEKMGKTTKTTKPKKSEKMKADDKTKKAPKTDSEKLTKPKPKPVKEKTTEKPKEKVDKLKKKSSKLAKVLQTPAKKRAAMMKRKSIGSIIKPPKMKPSRKVKNV